MDVQTIDNNYAALEAESQDTVQAVTSLAQKLQAAADAGDANAREWILDLKGIALNIRDEQTKVSELLQSLHGFVVNQMSAPPVQAAPPQAPPPQPQYQQPYPDPQYGYAQGGYPQGGFGGGGMLQRFLGGGFGRAVAMGAGFGLGDDLINRIF